MTPLTQVSSQLLNAYLSSLGVLTTDFHAAFADNEQQEQEESGLHRRHSRYAIRCRRSRPYRLDQRASNNSLLHVGRNSMIIQRRKPSMLNRVFYFRCAHSRHSPAPSNVQRTVPPPTAFNLPSTHQSTLQRSTDQVKCHPNLMSYFLSSAF